MTQKINDGNRVSKSVSDFETDLFKCRQTAHPDPGEATVASDTSSNPRAHPSPRINITHPIMPFMQNRCENAFIIPLMRHSHSGFGCFNVGP